MAADETKSHSDGRSPGEAAISRVYRAAAAEQPSAALDARIRAGAHEAVVGSAARGRTIRRWAIPFSIAATVVLSVSIGLQISRHDVVEKEQAASKVAGVVDAQAPPRASPRSSSKAAGEAAPDSLRPLAKADISEPAQSKPQSTLEETRSDKYAPARAASDQRSSSVGESAAAPAAAKHADRFHADVTAVRVSGSSGAYYFSVAIRSPDTGCARYADWWEVVGADERLLYRRVLLHSHSDEQPFERSGGPVPIQPDTTVWVRAHMNTTGYGGAAFEGSVKTGFAAAALPSQFAMAAAMQPPLPDGCAF